MRHWWKVGQRWVGCKNRKQGPDLLTSSSTDMCVMSVECIHTYIPTQWVEFIGLCWRMSLNITALTMLWISPTVGWIKYFFYPILFYSILFYSILFYSILCLRTESTLRTWKLPKRDCWHCSMHQTSTCILYFFYLVIAPLTIMFS